MAEIMRKDYREMLERNLEYMISVEETDPLYYGPKIRKLSDRLGV